MAIVGNSEPDINSITDERIADAIILAELFPH